MQTPSWEGFPPKKTCFRLPAKRQWGKQLRDLPMPQNLAQRLDRLQHLPFDELQALWSECFGAHPRFRTRRDFLARCLAYRLQEQMFGALTTATRKRLRKLAEQIRITPAAAVISAPLAKPGTRLIRQWRGEVHIVTLTDKGYLYRGKRHHSLSEIARLITGTRWSGPAFFGLKISAPTRRASARRGRRAEPEHAR
jgi:hypothetical protein